MPQIFTVEQRGVGKPDYTREVHKAKQLFGYELDYGETFLWLLTEAVPTPPGPGASAVTRGGLAAGATMQALDAFTGDSELSVPAGWDYILKEFWVSFDQDVEFILYQGGSFDDISCIAYIGSGAKPVNVFQTGWSRSLLENLSLPSVLRCDIKNLGAEIAYGKVWVIGFMKEGTYTWV